MFFIEFIRQNRMIFNPSTNLEFLDLNFTLIAMIQTSFNVLREKSLICVRLKHDDVRVNNDSIRKNRLTMGIYGRKMYKNTYRCRSWRIHGGSDSIEN